MPPSLILEFPAILNHYTSAYRICRAASKGRRDLLELPPCGYPTKIPRGPAIVSAAFDDNSAISSKS